MILSANQAADVIRFLYEDPAFMVDDRIVVKVGDKVYNIVINETDFTELPEGAEPIYL